MEQRGQRVLAGTAQDNRALCPGSSPDKTPASSLLWTSLFARGEFPLSQQRSAALAKDCVQDGAPSQQRPPPAPAPHLRPEGRAGPSPPPPLHPASAPWRVLSSLFPVPHQCQHQQSRATTSRIQRISRISAESVQNPGAEKQEEGFFQIRRQSRTWQSPSNSSPLLEGRPSDACHPNSHSKAPCAGCHQGVTGAVNESVSWSGDMLVIPLYLKRQALVEPPVSHPLRAASR